MAQFLGQFYNPQDLAGFQQHFKLPAQKVAKVVGPNEPSNPGVEATLDIEYLPLSLTLSASGSRTLTLTLTRTLSLTLAPSPARPTPNPNPSTYPNSHPTPTRMRTLNPNPNVSPNPHPITDLNVHFTLLIIYRSHLLCAFVEVHHGHRAPGPHLVLLPGRPSREAGALRRLGAGHEQCLPRPLPPLSPCLSAFCGGHLIVPLGALRCIRVLRRPREHGHLGLRAAPRR